MLYTIRTTSGREDIVLDMLDTKIQHENIDVKSVLHPAEIKGYIFAEGNLANIHKAIQGMLHVRGLIEKPIKLEQIQRFLEHKKTRIITEMGDVVEIIGGPFKAEKGKIVRIDKVKGEVTIELLEASIPIPVTIATELVKVIKRAKPQKEEEPEPPKEQTPAVELADEVDEEKIQEKPPEAEATLTEDEEEEAERVVEKEAQEEETTGGSKESEKEERTRKKRKRRRRGTSRGKEIRRGTKTREGGRSTGRGNQRRT